MRDVTQAVEAYGRALATEDESGVRAVFDSVADEQIDEFLAALEVAGLGVPDMQVDGTRLQRDLDGAGILPAVSEQVSMITSGTFADFVRARARAMGIGTDTLVDRAGDSGILQDDGDLTLAHEYVRAVLDGEDPPHDPDPTVVAALAQVLDASDSLLASVLDRPR